MASSPTNSSNHTQNSNQTMYKTENNGAVEAAVLAQDAAAWRKLSLSDVPNLARVAQEVHPGLPERDEVFSERLGLFYEGCLALIDNNNELCGYIISHPIRRRQPPALDSILTKIAPVADQFFIHNISMLPKNRGQGLAKEGLAQTLVVASRLATVGLVSVYNTIAFWRRFGFVKPEATDNAILQMIEHYGDNAVYLERENKGNLPAGGYRC
jgi:ribosomal protein S18 acetylase RimI-like enzyme